MKRLPFGGPCVWIAHAEYPTAEPVRTVMRTPTTTGTPRRSQQGPPRLPARRGRCGGCSCGALPAMHAQRIGLDLFGVRKHRQPVSTFTHCSVALWTLPDDLQASVFDCKPCAQIDTGKTYVTVWGVAPWTRGARSTARNRPADPVAIGLAQGLVASAPVVGSHAACSAGCLFWRQQCLA